MRVMLAAMAALGLATSRPAVAASKALLIGVGTYQCRITICRASIWTSTS
jgi:hypothetical protein